MKDDGQLNLLKQHIGLVIYEMVKKKYDVYVYNDSD